MIALSYDKPKQNGNVWPRQTCPAFMPRRDAALTQCWYCKYADFQLGATKALEVGVCRWPNAAGGTRGEEIR